MPGEVSTSSSVSGFAATDSRAVHWLLLSGNRLGVAGGFVAAVFAVFLLLVAVDLVAVGPDSSAATVFGSGLASGTLTVVTVALSINELILSRVFGSPDDLRSRLDGTRALRRQVQRHADGPATPTDPAAFLSMTARALTERARAFAATTGSARPTDVEAYATGIAAYGENIDDQVTRESSIVDVLNVILGTEYAENLAATESIRNAYAEELSEAARAELDAIEELIEAIAIARQFFKTLSLQQDFARLSRVLAYTGFVALLASLVLALVYRTDAVTVDPGILQVIVPLGLAVVTTPLAVFIAYILRAATIARHTVSVGSFVPPGNRTNDES